MAGRSGNKLLIFDTILNGHHSDYLTYLVEYWHNHQAPGELFVVSPQGFSADLPVEWTTNSSIRFVEIPEQELHEAQFTSRVNRAFSEWNLYVRYAQQIQPTHAVLMYFDLFQLGIWLGKPSPCPVSGIYFRPSFHYNRTSSLKEKVVELRKEWLLRQVLKNGMLENIFCLDKSSVPFIKKITDRVRVLPLSDPVRGYELSNEKVRALRESMGLASSRKIFLIFGFMDARKGTALVLNAIHQLSSVEKSQLSLLLAGQITDEYRETIENHIQSLDIGDQVCCQFNRINSDEIPLYFQLSDFVLTPYQKHVGMSSVVARAALANKPLISTDYGYMGYLVKNEKLGVTLDSESEEAIKIALSQALHGEIKVSPIDTERFSKQNVFESFASQILGTILKNENIET